jgi:phospholipid transport system transporter-binding protein
VTKLNIEQSKVGDVVLSGVLDRTTVPNIVFNYAANSENILNLDLSLLSKVDSAGLAWLIDILSRLQQQGINLKLHNSPEQLNKIMQLGQVSNLFE